MLTKKMGSFQEFPLICISLKFKVLKYQILSLGRNKDENYVLGVNPVYQVGTYSTETRLYNPASES